MQFKLIRKSKVYRVTVDFPVMVVQCHPDCIHTVDLFHYGNLTIYSKWTENRAVKLASQLLREVHPLSSPAPTKPLPYELPVTSKLLELMQMRLLATHELHMRQASEQASRDWAAKHKDELID